MKSHWNITSASGFDHAAFKDRLRKGIHEIGFEPKDGANRWQNFCKSADLPPEGALEAINGCKADIYPHTAMLERIAAALGRSLQWLLTGSDDESVHPLRREMHRLVDEYNDHDILPDHELVQLHTYLDQKLDMLSAHTPAAAYRRDLPRSWREVAWLHEEMIQLQG